MKVLEFVFSFLFVRNWYTGKMELSQPRMILFSSMLFIVLLGVVLAFFLQSPIEYSQVS